MGAPGRADRTVTVQRAVDATPGTIFALLAALAAPVIRTLGHPRRAVGSMELTLQRLADPISTD